MSDIIHLLPDSIANQIAAGEVVQRPASVVKELLENSIDAGSTSIKLIIKDAGKSLIQVIDNGKGMSMTDARMSFERHATSKIRTTEDLFKIHTLGFRGEALASIAAVAQVELKSKRTEDEMGTLLQIEASEVKKQEPIAVKSGTSIAVKNLFFNVPARRNFLKSNGVEQRHITDEFVKIALSNSPVHFSFLQNDQQVYSLESGKLSKRITQLFGKKCQQNLIACQESTEHVQVQGYVGKPEFSRKTRGEQYFFINDRFVKNSYLSHAIITAFKGLLKEGHFPFYCLTLSVDPAAIDINVHPTKTEVKFDDERSIYGVIHAAVKQALVSFNVAPSIDFSSDVSFDHLTAKREALLTQKERDYGQFKKNSQPDPRRLERIQNLYASAASEELISLEEVKKEGIPIQVYARTEAVSKKVEKSYQLHNKFLIRQVKSGMMILDKELALERILYEDYNRLGANDEGNSQACMFPQQVLLSVSDFNLVVEMKKEIEALGFKFETMGNYHIVIQGVPTDLTSCDEKEIFEELLEQYKQNVASLNMTPKESLYRTLSKRTANIQAKQLSESEYDHLFDRLFACSQPNYTPDGKATFVLIALDEMIDWFIKKN